MAKIKESKMGGVHAIGMDAYKPESSIRLEGAHAKALAKMPMKSSGTITIKGKKTSNSKRLNSASKQLRITQDMLKFLRQT